MNITPEIAIASGGFIVSIGGFIITAGIMLKSNKSGFKAIAESQKKDYEMIAESNKKGFDMVDLKFSNLIQVLSVERDGMKKDIISIEDDCEGVKDQLKTEIYPRLNSVEKNIEKNCRAVIDHKELCSERHRKGA
jgi:hypothetical protein